MNEFIARRKLTKWLKPVENQLSEGQQEIFFLEGLAYFDSPQYKQISGEKDFEEKHEAILQDLFNHSKNWVVGGIK